MRDRQPALPNRQTPFSEAFKAFIGEGWAPYSQDLPPLLPAAAVAPQRRSRLSALFPGERLVVPAGGLKVRSNDTDYRYRPHSAFAHLTGLGTDREPDAVLVLEPTDAGHDATLYFRPRAPRDSEEFYANARYGEMWVGQRPSLDEMSSLCGIGCAAISDLADALAKNAADTGVRVVRGVEDEVTALVDGLRRRYRHPADSDADHALDAELTVALSELRLTKDDFEADQMRQACAQTAAAFEAVVASLPEAVRRGRGERWVEGVFGLHARHSGIAVVFVLL